MTWLELLANVVDSVAWPVALVILALLLRKPLAALLPNIKQLRYGQLEVHFGEEIAAVRETAGDEDYSQLVVTDTIVRLAKESPRAAIMDTWVDVEKSITEAGRRTGAVKNTLAIHSPLRVMRALLENRKIDEGTYNLFNNLRSLRNDVAHVSDTEITSTQAINTCDMLLRLKGRLDEA